MREYIKELKNITFLCLVVIFVSFIFSNSIDLMSIAVTIIVGCSCVYFSSVIIIYKSADETINRLFKMLSIGFAGMGFIAMSYLYVIEKGGLESTVFLRLEAVFYITMFYEPIACICAFKLSKRDIEMKLYIAFMAVLVCFFVHIGLYNDSLLMLKEISLGGPWVKLVVNILFIISYIYIWSLMKKNKKDMTRNIYTFFRKYIIVKIFMQCAISLYIVDNNKLIIVALLLLTTLADYYILKIMVFEVIKFPQEILYKELYDKSIELENAVNDLNIAKAEIEDEVDKSMKILKYLPTGIIMLEENEIVYVNDEILRMFSINAHKELIGMELIEMVDSNYKGIINESIETYLEKAINRNIDIKLDYKGIKVNAEISGIEIVANNSKRILYMIRDISDKKELEKVENILEEKQKSEKVKNELLANISHEFKTPVNVIYSAIQIQDVKKDCGDIGEILKYNKTIKQNCFRLIRLINNFIDTTRFEDEEMNVEKNYLNIITLVEETTMSVLSFAESAGIEVVFDTNKEEALVFADSQLIERVILNLLSNSIKYSSKNGRIKVDINVKKDEIEIRVIDNGLGIPNEKQKLIFNRFERIDKSLSRTKEGSGLGLNIVKKIIELHDGKIKLESKVGIGTEVVISLPKVKHEKEILKINREYIEENSRSNYNVELEMSDIYL